MRKKITQQANLQILLSKNKEFDKQYHTNVLMKLITSDKMFEKKTREKMLDSIQTFSDYFQKVVMLRYAFCEDKSFLSITQQHLNEEFAHNQSLMRDRKNQPVTWNPILEATSSWFTWKMFTLDNEEKIVLVHLVLETSANIFFQKAHKVMQAFGETDYFQIHSELDEHHEKLGKNLLEGLSEKKYQRLLEVQQQGWMMLNTACEQIADSMLSK